MRVIVMFDLPVNTSLERRKYRMFRKYLIDDGFIMMQESIYAKICINMHAVEKVTQNIRKNRPAKGMVQVMTITERQYSGMKLIVGELPDNCIDSDERMVIL